MGEECKSHSGMCANMNNMKEQIEELKLKQERQAGYMDGMFSKVSKDVDNLATELRSEIKNSINDIKLLIEKKEMRTDSKKWIIISSIVSPTIVGLLFFFLNFLTK